MKLLTIIYLGSSHLNPSGFIRPLFGVTMSHCLNQWIGHGWSELVRIQVVFHIPRYDNPPVGWGSTYCFNAVGVGVGVLVGVTPITKAPPAQIFLGWHVFCSPGH